MDGHFRLHHVGEAEVDEDARTTDESPSSAALVVLLLEATRFDQWEVRGIVGQELLDVLADLGRVEAGTRRYVATVAMYARDGFFFSSRRRHTIFDCDWSSDVCSSDLAEWHKIAPTLAQRFT